MILLNVIMLLTLIAAFLAPLLFLPDRQAADFIFSIWYLPVVIVILLSILDFLYIRNRFIYKYLEEENWSALLRYLETHSRPSDSRDDEFGRISNGQINLYIQACYILSDSRRLLKLERFLRHKRPSQLRKHATALGIIYFQQNDPKKMEEYAAPFINQKIKDRDWMVLYYIFALILQNKNNQARSLLKGLLFSRRRDKLLKIIVLFVSDSFFTETEIIEKITDKKRITAQDLKGRFLSEIKKSHSNVYVVMIFSDIIDQSWEWLFK